MQYIHQHNSWPNFTWKKENFTEQLVSIRHQQGFLLGRMAGIGFDSQMMANLEMQTYNVLKTSEIEGEILSRNEVRSSVAKHLGVDVGGTSPISREVDGVVTMMLDATENFTSPLTEERLFRWHEGMFPNSKSGWHTIITGTWRSPGSGPMQVISGYMGREKVHFEAPPPEKLPDEMDAFFKWFNHNCDYDPIIKAGIAHFWFVTIHPFDDGNGRVARAIADMCLAKSDRIPFRFYSMSAQIEKERNAYYKILEQSQKSTLDITLWLTWFLDCLERSFESAHVLINRTLQTAYVWQILNQKSINDRQRKVVNRLLNDFKGKLTTQKYGKLATCSHDTALRDIQQLIADGIMKKDEGGGRNTSYSLVPIDIQGPNANQ